MIHPQLICESERLCIMFLLYWEVHVLMELVVNLQNEDLHWFSGKMTVIDSGVYMRFNGGVGSRVRHFLMDTKCFFLYQGFLKIAEAKSL